MCKFYGLVLQGKDIVDSAINGAIEEICGGQNHEKLDRESVADASQVNNDTLIIY